MRRIVALTAILVLVAAPALAETAQERANRLSQEIMSPFCPGLTLHDCPSDAARELRQRIEQMAADGMTDDQIVAELEAEYGPNLRAVPSDGNSYLVWAIPGIALLLGLLLAYRIARRWSRDEAPPENSSGLSSPTADDQKRIEAELSGLRTREWWRR